jgi:hypothetical protein
VKSYIAAPGRRARAGSQPSPPRTAARPQGLIHGFGEALGVAEGVVDALGGDEVAVST